MIPEDYHTQFFLNSRSAAGRHRFFTDKQPTSSISHSCPLSVRQACFFHVAPGGRMSRVQSMKKLNPINWTSEEFLTLHTECTLGQRAKGQRGIHPRPGRQALFKQAWNAWSGEKRRRRRRGRNLAAINMSNKYQHFSNDLHWLTSCATASEMSHECFTRWSGVCDMKSTSLNDLYRYAVKTLQNTHFFPYVALRSNNPLISLCPTESHTLFMILLFKDALFYQIQRFAPFHTRFRHTLVDLATWWIFNRSLFGVWRLFNEIEMTDPQEGKTNCTQD